LYFSVISGICAFKHNHLVEPGVEGRKVTSHILALAAIEDMEIHQMDVKTAFLNGDLKEEIYMEEPEGFTHEGEHLVCKLHKSLYGLKQSPRAWNQKLDAFLKNIEFTRSDADFSVYVTQVEDVKFFIVVYIGDFILGCNNKDKLLQVK
jgi:hypothetical protein